MVHTPSPPEQRIISSPQPPANGNDRSGYPRGEKRVNLRSPTLSSGSPPEGSPGHTHKGGPAGDLGQRVNTLGNLSDVVDLGRDDPPSNHHFRDDGASVPTTHAHEGAAALCTAASEGDELTLAALLETGHPVNKGDYDRRTALHLAAEEGHQGCVELLVQYGADVNVRDRWGTTPLKGAVHNLHNEVANYLRDHGAKLQDDAADNSLYDVNRAVCRRWFDRALQFCGLAPDQNFLPTVGLAGFLYVEHGIDVKKHKAIARELAPLRKALRSLKTGHAEADLKKWLSAGEQWTRNCMPPAPPQVKFTKATAGYAPSDSMSGKPTEGKGKASEGSSLQCSPGLGQYQEKASCGTVPLATPAMDATTCQTEVPMEVLAQLFEGQPVSLGGVPPKVAAPLYEMFGRSLIVFADFVDAVLGEAPKQKHKERRDSKGTELRGVTAPALQAVALGRLQVPNWRSFVESILELAARVLDGPNEGKNADYIPDLSEEKVDPSIFGVAICTVDGQQLAVGDTGCFAIQSCGKAFVYAQAVEEYGQEHVHTYVGQEPSGRAFNDFALTPKGQPFNAVTNAGAMMTASLYHPEETLQDRTVRYIGRVRRFSGEDAISVDEAVYKSEQGTAYRNHAIANFMMSEGCYPGQVSTMPELHRHVDFYLRTCAVRCNCQTLANMAATLANYGEAPLTGDKVLSFATVKQTLQLAYSCGMYNSSGEWACTVGIPAKSGVSGAIWLAVPGVLGLCVRSPRLDSVGNSVRGVRFSRMFAERFQWGVMDLLYRAKDNSGSMSMP
eukprot:TRINITY_DN3215_c0_g4_i2.p1 TRINITY_DN3215_c0_g4~~TRINITY_DN3215_c0_g4_i2.p1  ORF type:complete len:825 (+),score=264.66 TRINITY_DN3215_c0_g4_i2:125-2476(+)